MEIWLTLNSIRTLNLIQWKKNSKKKLVEVKNNNKKPIQKGKTINELKIHFKLKYNGWNKNIFKNTTKNKTNS